MSRRSFVRGPGLRAACAGAALLCALACGTARAEPIPFGARTADITAREQPIAAFLQDLFAVVGVPVLISPSAKGAVNGHFEGPAERTYRNVAKAFNLVEYYDGSVLHIYTPQDMVTRTLPFDANVSARLVRTVNELGMTDERNRLRMASDGMLTARGTRRFVEQVEEMARAQPATPRGGTAAGPSGLRVFYLRYAWAQDVTMSFGGRQVLLPGVASTVRALMTGQSRSQVAAAALEQPARGNVARSRGPAAPSLPARQGTLGVADADAQQPSGPTLVAAYAAGALPGMTGGNAPAAAPYGPVADAPQGRVEADARLNAVIVRDAPERMAQYEQLIASLDVEPQSIEIEATIIDVNTERLRELGINWRYTKGRSSLLFGRGDSSDLQLTPATPPGDITPAGRGGFVSAVLGNVNQFIARINALQDQDAARVVSSPQVLTLSNVEAVFDSSQTFYVRVAGRDEVDLFNVTAGTSLRVTPHVFRDGDEVRIKMLVAIEDGTLSPRTVDTLPVVDRSSINTQALIFEGESLLVGGITRQSNGDGATKVPTLGDLPLIGGLFRNERSSASHVERMFLITPRLVTRRSAQAKAMTPEVEAALPHEPRESALRVQDRRGARASYQRGERYEVEVSVQRSGHVYCYLIDDRKQLTQLFPNAVNRSAVAAAGSVLVLPGTGGAPLVASRKGGSETVACLNAERDLGFNPVAAMALVHDGLVLQTRFSEVAGAKVDMSAFELKVP